MERKDLRDLVAFSEAGPRHEALYESEHLWAEVLNLQGSQGIGPISDRGSDAICLVLAGKVVVQVDRGRARLEQWGSALVPKGSELAIRNASDEPAVILLVVAPPPTPRQVFE